MSRRSHLTEIGCIACHELEEIGAGEKEGWISDPTFLTAIHAHAHALAIASYARSLVLVIGWDSSFALLKPIKIRPSLSTSSKITALESLLFGDRLALAVCTSHGFILIFSVEGDLIHKQVEVS